MKRQIVMKSDILLQSLVGRIRERTPAGTNMASMLGDILCIGKEAVYRRLRGEVPFSFYETVQIAGRLGISLDEIVGSTSSEHALLHIDLMRFEAPREKDFQKYQKSMDYLRVMAATPEAEMQCCANVVPVTFMIKYRSLAEFKVFQWMYQYESVGNIKPLHEMDYPMDCNDLCQQIVTGHRNIPSSYYIFDSMMFVNLVGQIRYFAGVQLIREEEKQRIKGDLLTLIDEMEEIATRGVFETGMPVQMYISNFDLEATYNCYYTGPDNRTIIKFFSLDSIKTGDALIFEKTRNWLNSLRRTSVLISESGEMQRIQFFNEQRALVETL